MPNEGQFFIRDIKNANAGNQYSDEHLDDSKEWVRPWRNIDGASYKDIRGKDAIVPVLNSSHQVQFTNFNATGISLDFGIPGQQKEGADYIVGYPDMNNDGKIDGRDASYILALREGSRKATQEDYDKLNFYGDGPIDFEIASYMVLDYYSALSTGQELDWFGFINSATMSKYRDSLNSAFLRKHLRLIMPKYLRRVEVESLNRNFWVIGQTLSGITAYLAGDGSAYKTLLNGILDEITQLWENILYLWAASAMLAQKPVYTDIKTIHCYLDNNKEQPYLKYDNFDSFEIDPTETNEILKRLQHYQDEYPDSNLVIIPEIRSRNYKHNYYACSYFPYIYYYNRNTGKETLKRLKQLSIGEEGIPIRLDLTSYQWGVGGIEVDEEGSQYKFVKDWTYPQDGDYYALIRSSVAAAPQISADGTEITLSSMSITYTDISLSLMGDSNTPKTRTYTLYSETDFIEMSMTESSSEYTNLSPVDIEKGFYQGEILSYLKPGAIEFQVVKIGDFYPEDFLEGGTTPHDLVEITTKIGGAAERYDTQTYGIGAYTMKTEGTAWNVPTDKKLVFVDYYKYATGDSSYTVNGYDLTIDALDTMSENYICYLKKKNKLGDLRQDGLYATKFGTTYWNGDDGSQWSSGIIHALVYYNGLKQTAKVVSHPRLFDGYWTRQEAVFATNAGSQWRRLYLSCSLLQTEGSMSMSNGQLVWYDHWNDINAAIGTSYPRPHMDMDLVNGQLIFSNPINPLYDEGETAETNMAIRIKYDYNNNRVFWIDGSGEHKDIIGYQSGNTYNNENQPIRFENPCSNVDVRGGAGRGTDDFYID